MSKRSTVTVRERPVARTTSVTDVVTVHGQTFVVETESRLQIIDLTERVMALVRTLGVKEGVVHVFSMHTTCALFINEFQKALVADMLKFLERAVAHDADWMHNNPEHSDCDRMNADSHLRALLLGHSVTLQVSGSELVLGQWQRVLMAELDGPRSRMFRLQVMGT
ncbi:MAG TPA: secondary thiamine-phosphate synthase enzyme YjbQ [Vicinamibacterales bacterium]|nr:secondary thiamine-phosphate synthase enzyme YjbQ [Vicinamibacterales bacterium]